jgi:hypothetical protein
LIVPFLHHAGDINGDELQISRKLVTIACHPAPFVAELEQGALDQANVFRLIVAGNVVGPTLEVVRDLESAAFRNVITHNFYSLSDHLDHLDLPSYARRRSPLAQEFDALLARKKNHDRAGSGVDRALPARALPAQPVDCAVNLGAVEAMSLEVAK